MQFLVLIISLQLLDRKNNELEDMRSEHHLKVAKLESLNQRLERRLTQLERENSHLQEVRDKEASESRQAAKLLRQQLQADFDKKVQNIIQRGSVILASPSKNDLINCICWYVTFFWNKSLCMAKCSG